MRELSYGFRYSDVRVDAERNLVEFNLHLPEKFEPDNQGVEIGCYTQAGFEEAERLLINRFDEKGLPLYRDIPDERRVKLPTRARRLFASVAQVLLDGCGPYGALCYKMSGKTVQVEIYLHNPYNLFSRLERKVDLLQETLINDNSYAVRRH